MSVIEARTTVTLQTRAAQTHLAALSVNVTLDFMEMEDLARKTCATAESTA